MVHDRVMVAVDPRSPGKRAVEEAAVLARSHGAELVILVAYPTHLGTEEKRERDRAPHDQQWRMSPGSVAEEVAQGALRRARSFAGPGTKVRTRCEPGRPASTIAAAAREHGVDLLVVELTGGRGPTAITPRVVRALDRKAGCEVVVVTDATGAGLLVPAPGSSIEALPA